MNENMKQEKQTPPAPNGRMSDFRKALFLTAVPIIVLSAISIGGQIADIGLVAFSIISIAVWMLWGLAILTTIGFAIARKRQVAAGMLAGVAIGMVGLGATCFADMISSF